MRIRMWHPDIPHTRDRPPSVTQKSFDLAWSDLGWREWSDQNITPPEKPAKKDGLSDWTAYARWSGLEVPSDMSKPDVISLVEATEKE